MKSLRFSRLLKFHRIFAGFEQIVFFNDELLQLHQVRLVAVVQLSDCRSVIFVGAIELPHASFENAWDLNNFWGFENTFLILKSPQTSIASVLKKMSKHTSFQLTNKSTRLT